jgi:hypothetical protein
MNYPEIVKQRLSNQHLAGNPLETAVQLVSELGAVQAQDYFGAKWALGQRLKVADGASLDKAFNAGAILRTHMMRPTWHFVAPADIRWIQALTAPRVHVINGYMYRQQELDEAVFARSNEVIAGALEGSRFMTRKELSAVLEAAGIPAQRMRLAYIIMRAELDAVICSGPRRGKQFTYALLDERVPETPPLTYDEALAELTWRYFNSHGPATRADFSYWSGLTKRQVDEGLALVGSGLASETVDELVYWFNQKRPLHTNPSPTAHLLPNYDEYIISYRNSEPLLDPDHTGLIESQNPLFAHILVIDGRVLGTWRRDFEKEQVVITLRRFVELDEEQETAVRKAGEAFGRFWGLEVVYKNGIA